MSYVEKEKAIRLLRGESVAKYPMSFSFGLFAAADEISKLPTADAVEVRHGHWIKEFAWSHGYFDHHKLTCSECGLTFTEDARNVNEYKYCYGCGAKMDLEGRSEK